MNQLKPITEHVCDMLRERSERGLAKYGTTIDRDDLSPAQWLQHLQEELLDAAQYVEALKRQAAPPASLLTNPYTGQPRDYRDVETDPAGVLIVEPGAPLKAAPPAALAVDGMAEITRAWNAGYKAARIELGLALVAERQAQQPATAVPVTAAELSFISSFLELFDDSEPNALIAKRALAKIKAAQAQQPAAAVPEGWSGWAIQYPGKLPKLYGAEEIARMNWSPEAGADLVRVVEVDRVKASDWAAANKENE